MGYGEQRQMPQVSNKVVKNKIETEQGLKAKAKTEKK